MFSAADNAGMLSALGAVYQISLHDVPVFTITAIYDRGGQLIMINEVESVVTKPSLVLSPSELAQISKEHTIRTEDGDFKTFGGAVPDGFGLVRIELVKR